jgi:hypothetical protein
VRYRAGAAIGTSAILAVFVLSGCGHDRPPSASVKPARTHAVELRGVDHAPAGKLGRAIGTASTMAGGSACVVVLPAGDATVPCPDEPTGVRVRAELRRDGRVAGVLVTFRQGSSRCFAIVDVTRLLGRPMLDCTKPESCRPACVQYFVSDPGQVRLVGGLVPRKTGALRVWFATGPSKTFSVPDGQRLVLDGKRIFLADLGTTRRVTALDVLDRGGTLITRE